MAPLPTACWHPQRHPPLLMGSARGACGGASAPAQNLHIRGCHGMRPRTRVLHPTPSPAPHASPSPTLFLRCPAPLPLRPRPSAQQQQALPSEPHHRARGAAVPARCSDLRSSGAEAQFPLASHSASEAAAQAAAAAGAEAAQETGFPSLAPSTRGRTLEGEQGPAPVDSAGFPSHHLSARTFPLHRPPPPPVAQSLEGFPGAGLWWEALVRQLGLAVCLGAAALGLALAVPSHAAARAKAESKGGKPVAVATQASNATGEKDKEAALRNAAAAASFLEGLGVSTSGSSSSMGSSSRGTPTTSSSNSSAGAGASKKGGSAEQEGMERQAAAVEMLESFLKAHPDDIEALKMLLRVRLKAAQFPQGLQVLGSLMRLQPAEREWRYLHAQLLEYAGDLPGARRGFQDLLSQEPLSARALQGLASVMRRSGEDSLVLGMVEEAVKKASLESGKTTELTNLKLLLAQMHALQGNVDAALAQYDEILADNPKDFRPYLCKGLVLSLAGEGEQADKLFKEFRQRCPKAYAPYLDNVIVRSSLEAQRQQMQEKAVKAQGSGGRPGKPMTQPGGGAN